MQEMYDVGRSSIAGSGRFVFASGPEDLGLLGHKPASDLIKRDAATNVYSVWHKKWKGSPGYWKWKDRLERFVGFGRVSYIEIADERGVNTLEEAKALINFAQQNSIDSFYLVAPPFHMLRAFMTAASVAIKHGSEINFFAYPGAPQDLNQSVRHSQGKGPFPRWEWFEIELETISDYSEKNGIALAQGIIKYESIPRIIEYMKNRRLEF